jgi:holo-[acyl-carrier protein] synthase
MSSIVADFFIGTDIVSVVRIEKIIQKHSQRFKERTYTSIEIKYCDSKAAPPVHFAGRFAAKEAIKKALLSSGIVSNIYFSAIEIISSESGAPEVKLNHPPLDQIICKVSISHTDETAIAFALVRV